MLIWVSIWCHCLSAWKTSFSVSYRAHLLAVNLLSLCFSENEFIPPSFLKDSFAGYGILVRQFCFCFCFFPFSNLNMLSTPSYLPCFWREVNHCFIIPLYMITVFYYFENLICFWLLQFNWNVPRYVFVCIYSRVGFIELLGSVSSVLIKFGSFLAIISSCVSYPFPLFCGTAIICRLVCLMLSYRSLRLFSFLFILFSLHFLGWIVSIDLSSCF